MNKTLLTLLLATAALPALAEGYSVTVFAEPFALVAQLTPQERRALRERWEQASPEERVYLRREFQEREQERGERRRGQAQPGNGRDQRGQPGAMNRALEFRPPVSNNWVPNNWDPGNFGTGFERRRNDDEQANEQPPQDGFPGNFFPNRRRP